MSKSCEDFIKEYSEYLEEYSRYLIQTNNVIRDSEDSKYKQNKISSVTRMLKNQTIVLINQTTLTMKTQELLLVMLERVNKICDALEVRNER